MSEETKEIQHLHKKKFMPESWNGKNKHSVYTRCYSCKTFGICMPQDAVCGNCGSTETMQFWDAETIQEEISQLKAEVERWKDTARTWEHNYNNARAHAEIHANHEVNALKSELEKLKSSQAQVGNSELESKEGEG